MHKGEAGVGGAESWQGAALIWVKEAPSCSDGGQSDNDDSFVDF